MSSSSESILSKFSSSSLHSNFKVFFASRFAMVGEKRDLLIKIKKKLKINVKNNFNQPYHKKFIVST